jgi:hypothetical protein
MSPRTKLSPVTVALCAMALPLSVRAQTTADVPVQDGPPATVLAQPEPPRPVPLGEVTEPRGPTPSIPRRSARLAAARAACRDARGTDVFGVAAVPVLAVAGVSLAVVGFTTPEAQRNATTSFLNAFAPGLVLGAVGVPLGRGWIGAVDPLHAACDALVDHAEPSDADLLSTEGLLSAFGGPASPVLPILMASATAAVGGGLAAAFLIPNRDLAQAMGGIGAAVVAGWALVPATPNLRAARRHTLGAYAPSVTGVAWTGAGLSLAGAF